MTIHLNKAHNYNEQKPDNWIKQIIDSKDIDAIRVKFADMNDNFNKKRMSLLTTDERNKLNKKYARSYKMLVEAVNVEVE